MILRRLTEHLKQQHWTAIGIEFVLLVLGVFLGMQVSNWNEERGEKAVEIGYLYAMKADVDYSTGKLENLVGYMAEQQAARKKLYAYSIDPKATLAPAERDRLVLHGLFQLPSIDISQVTFDTLKSSGRLSLIRSAALVSELQSLNANVAEALRIQADELQVTYQFSDPLLVRNLDMAGVFSQPNLYNKPSILWLKDAPDSAPAPGIMKTQEFANVLLYRSFFTEFRLTNVRRMLEQHRRIEGLIKARQTELGVAP